MCWYGKWPWKSPCTDVKPGQMEVQRERDWKPSKCRATQSWSVNPKRMTNHFGNTNIMAIELFSTITTSNFNSIGQAISEK